MTAEEAARVFAEIAVRTNGWDEASSEAWMRDIQHLAHPDLAAHAARQLVDNRGDRRGRPEWSEFLAPYRSLLARRITEPRALSASSDNTRLEGGLPAYLERLKERVEAGVRHPKTLDTAPETELANWRRLAHANAPSLIPTTWQHTLTEDL